MAIQTEWWALHFAADETVYVNASIGPSWYTVVEGAVDSFTLRLRDDGTLTVANGETHTVEYETVEFYAETRVEQGGTLTVDQGGTLVTSSREQRWSRLDAYATHSGQAVVDESMDGEGWYADKFASADAPIDSLLVGVEPVRTDADTEYDDNTGYDDGSVYGHRRSDEFDGVWGIVMGATDERTTNTGQSANPGTWHMTLDIAILAPYSDYADVAAARAAHEAP